MIFSIIVPIYNVENTSAAAWIPFLPKILPIMK